MSRNDAINIKFETIKLVINQMTSRFQTQLDAVQTAVTASTDEIQQAATALQGQLTSMQDGITHFTNQTQDAHTAATQAVDQMQTQLSNLSSEAKALSIVIDTVEKRIKSTEAQITLLHKEQNELSEQLKLLNETTAIEIPSESFTARLINAPTVTQQKETIEKRLQEIPGEISEYETQLKELEGTWAEKNRSLSGNQIEISRTNTELLNTVESLHRTVMDSATQLENSTRDHLKQIITALDKAQGTVAITIDTVNETLSPPNTLRQFLQLMLTIVPTIVFNGPLIEDGLKRWATSKAAKNFLAIATLGSHSPYAAAFAPLVAITVLTIAAAGLELILQKPIDVFHQWAIRNKLMSEKHEGTIRLGILPGIVWPFIGEMSKSFGLTFAGCLFGLDAISALSSVYPGLLPISDFIATVGAGSLAGHCAARAFTAGMIATPIHALGAAGVRLFGHIKHHEEPPSPDSRNDQDRTKQSVRGPDNV